MQTREVLARLKKTAVIVSHRVTPFLITGSIVVYLGMLLAPKELQAQTCENARGQLGNDPSWFDQLRASLDDTGNILFYLSGAARAIVIPGAYWAYTKLAERNLWPTLSNYRIKSLEIWESELIKATSTGISIMMLPLSRAVTMPFLPVVALPLTDIFLKHQLNNYPGSATYQEYKMAYPDKPWLVNALTAKQCIQTGILIGAPTSAFIYYLINGLFDASHETDWLYQDAVTLGGGAMLAAIGMAAVFNSRAFRVTNHASSTLDKFWPMSMSLLSVIYCLLPKLIDVDTYMESGVYVWLGVSLAMAIVAATDTCLMEKTESEVKDLGGPKVEEVGESEEEYIIPGNPNSSAGDKFVAKYGTFANNNFVGIDVVLDGPRGSL